MHAGLDPVPEKDGRVGVGRAGDHVRAPAGGLAVVARPHLQADDPGHFAREALAVRLVGLKTRISLRSRTAAWAVTCAPACQPDPSTARVSASSRPRYFAASALVAPTRARCITPSGMIARGSPLWELKSSTSPT